MRLQGQMACGFSMTKQVAQLSKKRGWWFVVKAPERCFVEVDNKWRHKHWKWQKVKSCVSSESN